jgi:hypothetical protein
MSTNAEVITALENAKTVLQGQVDAANGATLNQLTDSIDYVSDEILAIEAKALANSTYVPATDAFKANTDEAKAFVADINQLKTNFDTAVTVAGVLDQVVGLITKVAL